MKLTALHLKIMIGWTVFIIICYSFFTLLASDFRYWPIWVVGWIIGIVGIPRVYGR